MECKRCQQKAGFERVRSSLRQKCPEATAEEQRRGARGNRSKHEPENKRTQEQKQEAIKERKREHARRKYEEQKKQRGRRPVKATR